MDTLNNTIIRRVVGNLYEGGVRVVGRVEGDTDAWLYGDHMRLLGKSYSDYADMEPRTFFEGHVLSAKQVQFDAFSSSVEIEAGTANYLMTGHLQAIGFTEQGSPANNHQLAATMRISTCFQHIVERHCNFIYNATTMPDGIITQTDIDTSDTAISRFNVREAFNFWSALTNQLGGGEEGGVQFYRPYFNRKNKLFYQPPSLFVSPAPSSKGTLTKEHIRGNPQITILNSAPNEQVGQVQLTATKGDNTTLTSKYPASQPTDGQIWAKHSGIFCDTQARLDTLAQNVYEWLTRSHKVVLAVDPGAIAFGDDGDGIDLGDKIAVTYDGPTEDTATGAGVDINWSAKDFWVYGYRIDYDVMGRAATASLTLESDN